MIFVHVDVSVMMVMMVMVAVIMLAVMIGMFTTIITYDENNNKPRIPPGYVSPILTPSLTP